MHGRLFACTLDWVRSDAAEEVWDVQCADVQGRGIGAVAVTAGCALVIVKWSVPQLAAFFAMLFIARGALHLVTTLFEGMPGALSALLGLGEVAVGLPSRSATRTCSRDVHAPFHGHDGETSPHDTHTQGERHAQAQQPSRVRCQGHARLGFHDRRPAHRGRGR